MSDKRQTSDEPQGIPKISPRGDGNPYERVQSFNRQRDAVLYSPDEHAPADDLSPSEVGGTPGEEEAERADSSSERREVMAEYRRRQRLARRS